MLRKIALLAVVALPASLGAQQVTEDDAHTTIRGLMDRIADEMGQVDGLLLQTAETRTDDGTGRARPRQQAGELLGETSATQGRVVRGIDALIEELIEHAKSGCGSGN